MSSPKDTQSSRCGSRTHTKWPWDWRTRERTASRADPHRAAANPLRIILLGETEKLTRRRQAPHARARPRRIGWAFAAALAVGAGCASVQSSADQRTDPLDSKQPAPACDFSGLAVGRGHEIRELEKPFVVRQVSGLINSAVGRWPQGTRPVFELRPLNGGTVKRIEADDQGGFAVTGISAGVYCFSASAIGWDPVMGSIVVSRRASIKARIELVLPIAN